MIRDRLYDRLIYALNRVWAWAARTSGLRRFAPYRCKMIHGDAIAYLSWNRPVARRLCAMMEAGELPPCKVRSGRPIEDTYSVGLAVLNTYIFREQEE